MDILRAWRRQREGAMERETTNPLLFLFLYRDFLSAFHLFLNTPPHTHKHTRTLFLIAELEVYQVGRRLEKSAVNECYFPRSKFISYVNAPSNCIGCVTSWQLLHLMVLHNCINMGHICMTLNEDGCAAKARWWVLLSTIKRSNAGLEAKLVSTNRPRSAARWTICPWSNFHLFFLLHLKPASSCNLNIFNVLGTN